MSGKRGTASLSQLGRVAAGMIALIGFGAIALRFGLLFARTGSASGAIWSMLRFYTIIGNALAALVFAAIALGSRRAFSPLITGGVTLNMALIGIVYAILLRGLLHLEGLSLVADSLMHDVQPLLIALFWLVFARKGALRWRDPWLWAVPPCLYFLYAMLRGQAEGSYPYFFINVATLGWPQTLLNAAAICLAFVAAGWLLVWLGHRIAKAG
ncbi:MAG: Pr6Pr family membrane protein [Sphingobium sp.]|nr:Pr6Pr family membrane protein [Sphingobium sp.]